MADPISSTAGRPAAGRRASGASAAAPEGGAAAAAASAAAAAAPAGGATDTNVPLAGGQGDRADLAAGDADAARVAAGGDPASPLRTGSLAEAAAALGDRPIPLLDGGPGIGAARVAERSGAEFKSRPIGTLGEELARAGEREPRIPAVTRDVLPRNEFAIDPDTVPGHRMATAAAQLRRNGLTYQPGEPVRVDFRAYSQLVSVAAILSDPWHRLPTADEPEFPEDPPVKA